MKESINSQDLSFFKDNQHNLLAPITTNPTFKKNPVFQHSSSHPPKTTSRIVNVLALNKTTAKLQNNEEFIDYLALDQNNSNLNIVTFLGPKQVGKSFLIDFIISKEEKSISRLLSKNSKPLVNIPTFDFRAKNGEKVIFFDTNEELSNETFIWTYFLSSMIVLNLAQNDKKGEELFIAKLNYLRVNLESQAEDLSLPQLIILRRDSNNKDFKDKEFVSKIQSYGFFSNDIATLNMAYPGSSNIKSKDIRDVSQNMLSQDFINDALNLSWAIKAGRPKTIKGNYIGSKIAGFAVQPLTQSINKSGKVNTLRIWTDIIETLSVGYYNFYMKKYSEQLQAEFSDQQPCDKYTLYKRLSKTRRNIDRKFEGFNMIAGDVTFQKYRAKIQENINKKQKIIKEINKRKSIERNDQLCKRLFSQMNDSNCQALIQQYNQSKLDDNKAQVLLNNFEAVIKKRLQQLQKSKNPAMKPSAQIQQLQKELKDLQQKIKQEKQNKVDIVEYDFAKVKAGIDQKQKQVKQLQQELQRQRKISNQKKNAQTKDALELQNKILSLRNTTREQEKQIERLKVFKEQQAKETIESLNKRLKQQEQKYQRLQQEVKKAQEASNIGQKTAKQATKQACCQVM